MVDSEGLFEYFVTNKMITNGVVLHTRVENWVCTQVHCSQIVIVDGGCVKEGDGDFLEDMLNPIELCSGGGNNPIFSLSGGASNSVLLFRALTDRVGTYKDYVGRGRGMSINVVCPVCI